MQINNIVDICSDNGITFNQYLFCYMIYNKRIDLLYKYESIIGFDQHEIEELENKGFIFNYNKTVYEIDSFSATEKLSILFKSKYTAIEELKEVYPKFAEINGKKISLINSSNADLWLHYSNYIVTPEEHKEILKITQKATKLNLINMSISKYIRSAQWKYLKDIIHQEDIKGYGETVV